MLKIPTLEAGKLRHRIQIVQPATQQDAMGGLITADETVSMEGSW
jgi:hypothetical protein